MKTQDHDIGMSSPPELGGTGGRGKRGYASPLLPLPSVVSPSPTLARVVGGPIVTAWAQSLAALAGEYFLPLPEHLKFPDRRIFEESKGENKKQGQGVMDERKLLDAMEGWKGAPMGHRGGPHQGMI